MNPCTPLPTLSTSFVLLPVLAQTLGLSYVQVGVIRALHTAAQTGLELPSGILAERVGERSLLVLGLFCAGLGYLCLSLSSGLYGVAVSLFVAGIGSAFQHALCSSIISRAFADTAPRGALGTYNSAGDAGKHHNRSKVGFQEEQDTDGSDDGHRTQQRRPILGELAPVPFEVAREVDEHEQLDHL